MVTVAKWYLGKKVEILEKTNMKYESQSLISCERHTFNVVEQKLLHVKTLGKKRYFKVKEMTRKRINRTKWKTLTKGNHLSLQ